MIVGWKLNIFPVRIEPLKQTPLLCIFNLFKSCIVLTPIDQFIEPLMRTPFNGCLLTTSGFSSCRTSITQNLLCIKRCLALSVILTSIPAKKLFNWNIVFRKKFIQFWIEWWWINSPATRSLRICFLDERHCGLFKTTRTITPRLFALIRASTMLFHVRQYL